MSEKNLTKPAETTTPATSQTTEPKTTTEVSTSSSAEPSVLDIEAKKVETPAEDTTEVAEEEIKLVVPEEENPVSTPEKTEEKKEEVPASDDEYELELPEGSILTEADLDEIVAIAEELDLSKEAAEKLLKDRESVYKKGVEATTSEAKRVFEAEKQKLLDDPAFKGEKLVESLDTIDLAVQKLGGDEMREFLKGPAGNSLPLAKFLLRVGKALKPDNFVGRSSSATPSATRTQGDALKDMYPTFFEGDKK